MTKMAMNEDAFIGWCPWCERELPIGHGVDCDDATCKAICNPTMLADFKAAYEHWRDHQFRFGCSHGC